MKRDLLKHYQTTSHITKDNLSKAGTKNDADSKELSCDICLNKFKLRSSMLRHRKYHFTDLETKEENKYHDNTNISSADCRDEDNGEPDNSVLLTHDNEGKYDSQNKGIKYIKATRTSVDDSFAEENMYDQNEPNCFNDNEDENINDTGATVASNTSNGVPEEPFEPYQITYIRNDSEEGGYEIKCAIM